MLARALRIAQLLELAACLLAGAWLHASRGWGPLAVALGTVAWFLGIRLVLVLFSSALAWVYRTPRAAGEGIGLAGTLRLLLGEWRALLLANLAYLPWEDAAVRPDPPAAPAERIPVVLVHGYFANRGYFRPLLQRLEPLGIAPIFVPTCDAALGAPVEAFADELHACIERIVARTGQPRVVIVGHSLGGLAARTYLARHGTRRVERLVTLGTPHHGTVLARLGPGANARQMQRHSQFLEELECAEAGTVSPPQLLSIYSRHDNMVFPQETSRMPGARAFAIAGVGHIAMLRSPLLLQALVAELRDAGAAPPG